MSVTLIALVIYFLFLFAFIIYSTFAIYHLWQFGYVGDLCKPVAIGYLIISATVVCFTLIFVLINLIGS